MGQGSKLDYSGYLEMQELEDYLFDQRIDATEPEIKPGHFASWLITMVMAKLTRRNLTRSSNIC
jgi:hypothetical protein